jgi:hypothetical protein
MRKVYPLIFYGVIGVFIFGRHIALKGDRVIAATTDNKLATCFTREADSMQFMTTG